MAGTSIVVIPKMADENDCSDASTFDKCPEGFASAQWSCRWMMRAGKLYLYHLIGDIGGVKRCVLIRLQTDLQISIYGNITKQSFTCDHESAANFEPFDSDWHVVAMP